MPYLILVIGLLIGLYALYRFFLNASVQQIKAFILSALAFILGIAIFAMAITGRLPAALALSGGLIPLASTLWKMKKHTASSTSHESHKEMTRSNALEVLGLKDDADENEIKNAYKKLMQKVHPDNEGSDWMAAKLNQAKDTLLKKR
ncbi:MAG: DnaJ domain-containing protein [Alphaproteobacteria bacterium]|nr:DnaJ domain-containing protein [Alphaproteobacteria bacterium]